MAEFRQQPDASMLTVVVSVTATDETGNAVPAFALARSMTATREESWTLRQKVASALGLGAQSASPDEPRRG